MVKIEMDDSPPPTVAASNQAPRVPTRRSNFHQDKGVGPQTVQPTLPLPSIVIWDTAPMQTVNLRPNHFKHSLDQDRTMAIGSSHVNVRRPTFDTVETASLHSLPPPSDRDWNLISRNTDPPVLTQTAYGTSSGRPHTSNPVPLHSAVDSWSLEQSFTGSSDSMAAGTSGCYAQSGDGVLMHTFKVGGHLGSQLRNNSLDLTMAIGPPCVNATQSNFYQGRGVASAGPQNVQRPSWFTTTFDTLQAAGSPQTAYGTSSGRPHTSNPMLLQSAVGSSSQQFIRGSSNSMAAGTRGYYAQSAAIVKYCQGCREDLNFNLPTVTVQPCSHGFHVFCLKNLPPLLQNSQCPDCHFLVSRPPKKE